jgi:hypothetical protein
VTSVFIEPAVLFLGQEPEAAGSAVRSASTPGRHALEAVATLRESGHEVAIILGPAGPGAHGGATPRAWLVGMEQATEGPGVPSAGSWLVTADPRRCEHRPPGVRTILVGPRRPPGPRPTAHCDVLARDLSAAVMEILTREAMA